MGKHTEASKAHYDARNAQIREQYTELKNPMVIIPGFKPTQVTLSMTTRINMLCTKHKLKARTILNILGHK